MEEISKHLEFDHQPPVSNGLMLAALTGPHNAGLAATTALTHLMGQARAARFAWVDPDRFFTYDHTSPSIERYMETGMTRIHWPHLEFHHSGDPAKPGPAFLTGSRPRLGLMEFTRILGKVARACGVRNILQLTAGYGGRAHTRPTVISAIATIAEPSPELEEMVRCIRPEPGARPLEDPALLYACLAHELGYASVCAQVPDYLTIAPNHQGSLDLLRSVQEFAGTGGGMEEPERRASEFNSALERAMAESPTLRDIVRAVEEEEDAANARRAAGLEVINTGTMTEEIERFLRAEREEDHGSG